MKVWRSAPSTREERRANVLAATLNGSSTRPTGANLAEKGRADLRRVVLITFVVSIPAVILYAPVLHPAKYIVGAGADTRVRSGAVCELILIIANIGTAVVVFPILRRQSEILALG